MSQNTRILCLVRRTASEKGLESVRKKLTECGYAVQIGVLEEASRLGSEWLTENLSSAKGFLFLDEPVEFVREFVERLRGLNHSAKFLPSFFVYTSTKRLVELEQTGVPSVSDFFSVTEPVSRLRLRLVTREAESAERAAIYRTAQEQSTQLAKIDTTLKQREEFLGVCAHDLRSPLGLIQTCLSMVLKSGEADGLKPSQSELLTRAHRQSGHALSLVKDLLDVVALEQGLKPHYQMIKLHELLNEFYIDYSFQAQQKDVRFHYYNPVQEWQVLADSERIKQLLQNLFTNALKFTEPGKNIYLNVAPFQGRRKHDPPHPMVIISLKDEGKGIPQSEMQKIFDRFVQIKERSREGGRGLGLTVAKQISTLHDGNIWVESEEGRGSTFFVLFPHTISRLSGAPKVGERRRLLVAEPSEDKQKELRSRLTGWGYEVEFAADGVEAITLLFHQWPDALLLTPDLAKIGSAEVANLLKSHPRVGEIPILLISPPALHSKKSEGILADAILSPSFSQSELRKALTAYEFPGRKAA